MPHLPTELLVARTRKVGPIATRLRDVGCTLVQPGEDGHNLTFPVLVFDEVAEIMRPHSKRQLVPAD